MGIFNVGLDLGQASDYTALSVLETSEDRIHNVRHLRRFKLGTSYPDIVANVAGLMKSPPLNREAMLIVDQTGVGRPVVDMFRAKGIPLVGVTITGGNAVTSDGVGGFLVPKRDLISNLQVLLQTGRLKFAEQLADGPALIKELLAYEVKVSDSGHDSYGNGRAAAHDDMVLSVAMAAWYAERYGGSIFL